MSASRLAWLAGLAVVVYGGWAAWANHAHGAGAAMRAFAVQGFSSATTTVLMGGVIEWLRHPLGDTLAAKIAGSLLATLAGGVFHVVLHSIAGTPETVRTVVPSVALGFLFSLSYTLWTSGGRSTPAARRGRP